jgi:hypothetical protein
MYMTFGAAPHPHVKIKSFHSASSRLKNICNRSGVEVTQVACFGDRRGLVVAALLEHRRRERALFITLTPTHFKCKVITAWNKCKIQFKISGMKWK